jgi:hypothetical protein
VGQQAPQRGQGLLGPIFLPEREGAVEDDHAHDGQPQGPHPGARIIDLGDEGQPGGQPEDEGQEVRETAHEAGEQRRALHTFDAVGPELQQAPLRLDVRQPLRRSAKAGQRLGHARLVDLHDPALTA